MMTGFDVTRLSATIDVPEVSSPEPAKAEIEEIFRHFGNVLTVFWLNYAEADHPTENCFRLKYISVRNLEKTSFRMYVIYQTEQPDDYELRLCNGNKVISIKIHEFTLMVGTTHLSDRVKRDVLHLLRG